MIAVIQLSAIIDVWCSHPEMPHVLPLPADARGIRTKHALLADWRTHLATVRDVLDRRIRQPPELFAAPGDASTAACVFTVRWHHDKRDLSVL